MPTELEGTKTVSAEFFAARGRRSFSKGGVKPGPTSKIGPLGRRYTVDGRGRPRALGFQRVQQAVARPQRFEPRARRARRQAEAFGFLVQRDIRRRPQDRADGLRQTRVPVLVVAAPVFDHGDVDVRLRSNGHHDLVVRRGRDRFDKHSSLHHAVLRGRAGRRDRRRDLF